MIRRLTPLFDPRPGTARRPSVAPQANLASASSSVGPVAPVSELSPATDASEPAPSDSIAAGS